MFKQYFQKSSLICCVCVLMTCLGFTASDMQDIKKEITQQNYSQAITLVDLGLAQSPDKFQEKWLGYYQGLAFLRLADYENAERVFKELMEKTLKGALRDKIFLGLLDTYFLNEEYDKALSVGLKLLSKNDRSDYLSLIYLKLGRTNMKLANWQDAHRFLKLVVSQFPESLEYDLAMQFLEEKQYFAVQVGSFTDRDRAQGLVEELILKDEYAYFVESSDREKKKHYRVRVGKMSRLAEAKILESKLSSAGYPTRIYP